MRFSKLAVLAIVAPTASAFVVPNQQSRLPFAGKAASRPLNMAIEDLEAKLLGTEEKPKKQAKRVEKKEGKPKPEKRGTAKKEPEKSPLSLSDIEYEFATPAAKEKPSKPEKKQPASRAEKPKPEKKKPAPRAEKPKPEKKQPPQREVKKREIPKREIKVLEPPKFQAPSLPQPAKKPKKPVPVAPSKASSGTDTVVKGVALGAAPLLAPLVALGAGRSFLTKTAQRRQKIQDEVAEFEAKKKKRQEQADIDAGGLFTAVVRF